MRIPITGTLTHAEARQAIFAPGATKVYGRKVRTEIGTRGRIPPTVARLIAEKTGKLVVSTTGVPAIKTTTITV